MKAYFKSQNQFNLDENYSIIQKEFNNCPICNARSRLIFPFRFHKNTKEGKIQCSNCGAYVIADSMYQAIDDWNNGYVANKEDKDPLDIFYCRGDINYFDDTNDQYYLDHICCGYVFDGNSIYAMS